MYAKLIQNKIVFAQIEFEGWTNIETGVLIPSPTEQDFIDAGYQKVIENRVENEDGKISIPYYVLEGNNIVQYWKHESIPI